MLYKELDKLYKEWLKEGQVNLGDQYLSRLGFAKFCIVKRNESEINQVIENIRENLKIFDEAYNLENGFCTCSEKEMVALLSLQAECHNCKKKIKT